MDNKKCNKCGESKPRNNKYFFKHQYNVDRLDHTCKECRSKIQKATNQRRKEKLEKMRVEKLGYEPLKEGERRCSKCRGVFPATTEYFNTQKDSKSGLHSWCKECKNANLRERNAHRKKMEKLDPAYVASEYQREVKEMDAMDEIKYNKMINEPMDVGISLKEIRNIKFIIGKEYLLLQNNYTAKQSKGFRGIAIHQTNRTFTLQKESGIKETFLKVDIILRELTIKGVK